MIWERAPQHDRRFAHGDDFAGDAWRHSQTGAIKFTVVGGEPPPIKPPCRHQWVTDKSGLIDTCIKCGEERA